MHGKEQLYKLCRNKGGCNLNESTFQICATFLFYTSWFEELLFNDDKRQNPINDKKICKDVISKIYLSKYDWFGDYFCNRYVNDNKSMKHTFNQLRLSPTYEKEVANALHSYCYNKTYSWELLWSYLQIVYRFRNNMFHGSKGLINLNSYVEQFEKLNSFLSQLLTEIIDLNYKGYN